jgi:hypothetical protein
MKNPTALYSFYRFQLPVSVITGMDIAIALKKIHAVGRERRFPPNM